MLAMATMKKISRLPAISSKAASITMSASAAAVMPTAGVISAMRSSRLASLIEPRFTEKP